jgi:endonuclease/exonuclease/phosphatase family metal-dependent hydrolase
MPIRVVSYNVLADVHIKPGRYEGVPAELLDPARRRPALIEAIAGLNADVLCLQEAEPALCDELQRRLGPLGYSHCLGLKRPAEREGCATFYRTPPLTLAEMHTHHFRDGRGGEADSGHLYLLLRFEWGGRALDVVNAHLKWGPAGVAEAEHWAVRQAEAVAEWARSPERGELVVCGDFNVTPDHAALAVFRQAGLRDAHAGQGATSNFNGRARKIDYILHTAGLRGTPVAPPPVPDQPPLPWPGQPSDHVPVPAWFG